MSKKMFCKKCINCNDGWCDIYGVQCEPIKGCDIFKKKNKKTNMEKVAKMLGVEIGEEFNITYDNRRASTYDPYFIHSSGVVDKHFNPSDFVLRNLLNGTITIQKIPPKELPQWKPKNHDIYFSIGKSGIVTSCVWLGFMVDYYYYNAGNCFKTKEEITPEIKERILREMKDKYDE